MKTYEIEVYETEDGDAPFQDWLDGIKSAEAKTQVVARIAGLPWETSVTGNL